MIRISYSAPDEIELAGTKSDFAALWAELQSCLSTTAEVAKVSADREFDPAPYAARLDSIEFRRGSGPSCVSVEDDVLRISGSAENLALFGSWIDFERASAPRHSHYEYYDGNQWVARDSLPLVISLERDAPYNKAFDAHEK